MNLIPPVFKIPINKTTSTTQITENQMKEALIFGDARFDSARKNSCL
jgi:hypothetical protein